MIDKKRRAVREAPSVALNERGGSATAPMAFESAFLLRSIVRGFLGHEHVVDVTFADARVRDPDEFGALAQIGHIGRAYITHTRLQTADELFDIRGKRAAMGYAAFDSFGYHLAFGDCFLTVAIPHPLAHRAERAHSAIELIGPPLVEDGLAGTFLGPGE